MNKCDLVSGAGTAAERSGIGEDGPERRCAGRTALDWARQRFANAESALITRDRQRRAIEACCAHLERGDGAQGLALELVTEEVRLAARELARLVGRIDVEDLLDVVFRDFCIGKSSVFHVKTPL
jgi:tRNA modification GTPase